MKRQIRGGVNSASHFKIKLILYGMCILPHRTYAIVMRPRIYTRIAYIRDEGACLYSVLVIDRAMQF